MQNRLSSLIDCFWHWIQLSPNQYAELSRKRDLEEFLFPQWNDLINETEKAICTLPSEEAIDQILTVMAFDNECEDVLDYIVSNGTDAFIAQLLKIGVHYCQPHARWQCAELIRKRCPENGRKYLYELAKDPDEYVRKRAINAACSYPNMSKKA